MKLVNIMFLATSVVLVTGCASIVGGTNQSVSVNTGKVDGASCAIKNDKGVWYIPQTPGSTVIHRSYGDLKVDCKKKNLLTGRKTVASSTKPLVFGNVLFGGLIGVGVDVLDGAAYDYPNDISIPMQKSAKA